MIDFNKISVRRKTSVYELVESKKTKLLVLELKAHCTWKLFQINCSQVTVTRGYLFGASAQLSSNDYYCKSVTKSLPAHTQLISMWVHIIETREFDSSQISTCVLSALSI